MLESPFRDPGYVLLAMRPLCILGPSDPQQPVLLMEVVALLGQFDPESVVKKRRRASLAQLRGNGLRFSCRSRAGLEI